jgi:hypothetical protein
MSHSTATETRSIELLSGYCLLEVRFCNREEDGTPELEAARQQEQPRND